MPRDKNLSRQKIIDAAVDIAVNQGPRTLTLDNVAEKCNMSKGGVMHHFKSKEALLEALLGNLMDTFKRYETEICEENQQQLAISRILRTRQRIHERVDLDYARLFLVAANENPDLLGVFSQHMAEFVQELREQPGNFWDSIVLWLAIDGLSFQELMSVSPFTETERNTIREKLISMAEALGENTGEK